VTCVVHPKPGSMLLGHFWRWAERLLRSDGFRRSCLASPCQRAPACANIATQGTNQSPLMAHQHISQVTELPISCQATRGQKTGAIVASLLGSPREHRHCYSET
jgi:hypothetical protein